ncbi:MAG: nucleoside deaminase [Rhodanobacter sp.]
MLTDIHLKHLHRCSELAREARATGNPPFGSLRVSADGKVLGEDCNQLRSGDRTRHPEMSMPRCATTHLAPAERVQTTVYPSGEHCAMCAAAHGWAGLERMVYATFSVQLAGWLAQWKIPCLRAHDLSIQQVSDGIEVDGPAPGLVDPIDQLHRQFLETARATE